MRDCCLEEARRSLERHRDVATCDRCGALLLAYANERDYQRTLDELTRHGVFFETTSLRGLHIVAKPKT
jgi:hypothetical protein